VATLTQGRKVVQTWSFRGSKSRNKVSVGEPAEGSLNAGGVKPPPRPKSALQALGRHAKPSVYSTFVALAGRVKPPAHAGECPPEDPTRDFSDV
jgi:hypothetical protein